VANLYALFRQLQPQSRLLVGDVIQTAAGGVVVELPDGSLAQARGDAQIGDRVFLRDGVIEGPAPALSVEVIEI